MGVAIGTVLVLASIASFVLINRRVSRMSQYFSDDPRENEPQARQPEPPQQGRDVGGE